MWESTLTECYTSFLKKGSGKTETLRISCRRKTEEREYKPLETIKDNFPKYILTRSDPIQHRNGIIHKNMSELMKNGELF